LIFKGFYRLPAIVIDRLDSGKKIRQRVPCPIALTLTVSKGISGNMNRLPLPVMLGLFKPTVRIAGDLHVN